MSTFNGKVKKVISKQNSEDKTETIVEISDDHNSEVSCVKVIYPSEFNPSVNPVECDFIDIQNGNRIFLNDTLILNSSAPGKPATLFVTMKDANDKTLGKTATFPVTIQAYIS
jgi:hypothetical protein